MTAIRPATVQDLPGAYRVCLLTGDAGRDASSTYRNPDLLGHVFVGAYVVGEPELATVVTDADGVAGYLLGALDTRAFEAWQDANWWPPLRDRYPPRDDGTPEAALVARIHAPVAAPERVVRDYPSHLHIDLLERVRGLGVGRTLVDGMVATLRARGSAGVHLDASPDNPNAIGFYGHLGFEEVARAPGSVFMARRLG